MRSSCQNYSKGGESSPRKDSCGKSALDGRPLSVFRGDEAAAAGVLSDSHPVPVEEIHQAEETR